VFQLGEFYYLLYFSSSKMKAYSFERPLMNSVLFTLENWGVVFTHSSVLGEIFPSKRHPKQFKFQTKSQIALDTEFGPLIFKSELG
jgi:hypothetical protein